MTTFIQIISSALIYSSLLFLLSSGLGLILGVMRIINLVHASFYSLGAYLAISICKYFLKFTHNVMILLVFLVIAGLFVSIIALGVEVSLLRPIYKRAQEYQIILTFGIVMCFLGIIKMIFGMQPKYITEVYSGLGTLEIAGVTIPVYNFFLIGSAIIIAVLLWAFLNKTMTGRIIKAVAERRDVVEALGINSARYLTVTYMLGGALAGLSGSLTIPLFTAVPGMGIELLILAFAVVAITGAGSLFGSFITSLIIGFIRSIGIWVFPEIELALIYLIMVIVLIIKPSGLFVKESIRV